jgi:hypothetical protein
MMRPTKHGVMFVRDDGCYLVADGIVVWDGPATAAGRNAATAALYLGPEAGNETLARQTAAHGG